MAARVSGLCEPGRIVEAVDIAGVPADDSEQRRACRIGSDELMVWQVAHCYLNSAAPSGGLGAGSAICAAAIFAASATLQNASPTAGPAHSIAIPSHLAMRRC